MSITYVLSLFSLLAVSSGTAFLARQVRVPYTVLLVAVGTFVLLPLSRIEVFSFIDDFTLTPELLFYIFLPILIFESAYNMDIRRLVENIRSIALLSVVSLLISALLIATGLKAILGLWGVEIPFIVTLLFGALISATDPVAVLALFKEYGAPRRLSLIFEGESIFNDGTAVALFLVVLGIALHGFNGIVSIAEGVASFTIMVTGGIAIGLILGGTFAKLVGYARSNEFVSITLTIVLAHITFISTELLSQHLIVGNFHIHLSSIIATAIASMVMGNYGRPKIPPQAEEFVEKFWGQFAFLANSLVFIMIGLIFSSLPFTLSSFLFPIAIAVVVVAAARAASIYPVTMVVSRFTTEAAIPRSWSHLLAWGSLRGALAVTMVLLIPDTLTVSGWAFAFTPKEFIMALTIGCIFVTLFLKATTMRFFIDRFRINASTEMERVEYNEARALVYLRVLARLEDFAQKGYIDSHIAERLVAEHKDRFETSCRECKEHLAHASSSLADRALRLFAIGIERHYLKELYAYGEVSERVYKRILGKLDVQHDRLERGSLDVDPSEYTNRHDVFETLATYVRKVFFPHRLEHTPEERYMYYRAQSIIARKVLKEFAEYEYATSHAIFDKDAHRRTVAVYEEYRTNASKKMEQTSREHPGATRTASEALARKSIRKVEEITLHELQEKHMVTPKTYIALRDELFS